MLIGPLSTTGHGVDHIETISSNTFSIVTCAYFGRCLEVGLHVTIHTNGAHKNNKDNNTTPIFKGLNKITLKTRTPKEESSARKDKE
jgi:hypothetical protein